MEIILTIGGVCIVLLMVFRHQLYYHFRVVDKGKLYRCGQLSQLGLALICKQYGIKTVVNLIEESRYGDRWFLRHKSFCENNGINFIPIPLMTPPPPRQIQQFIDICDNDANHPILVHCKQGVLRTGIVIAIYQKHYCNMDNETIYKTLPRFGHNFNSRRYESFRKFILSCKADQ